ncbi:MAG: sigma-70 family RNA polymerase sigma factor [Lachnospiraceae bacterium]|nr:sigma-70 family RNA polymerase sigma factor [Lachnospiraceae bacterium]
MSDEELCTLSRDGDREAEEQLIRELLPSLRITAEEFISRYGSLQLEADDLIQEASIRILRAAKAFQPEMGFRFRTYAETVSGNAMTDYVRKCVTLSPPAVNLVSLDDIPPGFGPKDGVTYKDALPDGPSRIPEKICLWKETLSELGNALLKLSDRERAYLFYRLGFEDGNPHDLRETAAHFHLSMSRAKHIEETAIDNVWLELPWWYPLHKRPKSSSVSLRSVPSRPGSSVRPQCRTVFDAQDAHP